MPLTLSPILFAPRPPDLGSVVSGAMGGGGLEDASGQACNLWLDSYATSSSIVRKRIEMSSGWMSNDDETFPTRSFPNNGTGISRSHGTNTSLESRATSSGRCKIKKGKIHKRHIE